jgi:hypothetical protein
MLIPGACFLALWPGIALLIFSILYRSRMHKLEYFAFSLIAISALLMLPCMFGSTLVFDW